MFFRFISKFRAENAIKAWLFYALSCSQLAQRSRSAKTFAAFFYGFALKNWHKSFSSCCRRRASTASATLRTEKIIKKS